MSSPYARIAASVTLLTLHLVSLPAHSQTAAEPVPQVELDQGTRELWEGMHGAGMITDEQFSHVLTHGRLPGGSTVQDSPVPASRQETWAKLSEQNLVTPEELANMLFKGAVPSMAAWEVKAFEDLAPVYEPDRRKRVTYDVRRKHQRVELIRLSHRLTQEWEEEQAETEQIAREKGLDMRGTMPNGRSFQLLRFTEGVPQYVMSLSSIAADTISTDEVQPGSTNGFSLSGASIEIGMWDVGVPVTNHQEFATGRVVVVQSAATDFHATKVAGVLVARGAVPAAKGMAIAGTVSAYDFGNDVGEMASASANGMRVSNHSYGIACGWEFNGLWWVWYGPGGRENRDFGRYGEPAQLVDGVIYTAGSYLPVWAVGNDRSDNASNFAHDADGWPDGYDTVRPHQTAKNSLVVGAVHDVPGGHAGTGTVSMTAFSGWGPTDDGRIKPDLVANGTGVYTPAIGGYMASDGTSFASPSVAGSIALLSQLHSNLHGTNSPLLASTMRGLVLHTADECGWHPGPDYRFGWGLMNTLSAARVITNNAAWSSLPHIKEVALNDGDYIEFDVYAVTSTPLKVTVCWTDPPGPQHPAAQDPTNIVLVNDIDLRVISSDGLTTNFPWVLDHLAPSNAAAVGDNIRDNVEQVVFTPGANGIHTVKVTHKGALSNGVQDVSILITGNTPTNAPDFMFTGIDALGSNRLTSVAWPGVVGAVYQVEGNTNLLQASGWTNAAAPISAPREVIMWADDESNAYGVRFYRVKRLR